MNDIEENEYETPKYWRDAIKYLLNKKKSDLVY